MEFILEMLQMKNKLKTLLKAASLFAFCLGMHGFVVAESLDDRIKAMNDKIKNYELEQNKSDKQLQALVDEYNELIRQKEMHQTPVEHVIPQEQSFEEALLLRMKEYENKLDYLNNRVRFLEEKLGVVAQQMPQASDVTQDVSQAVATTSQNQLSSSVNLEEVGGNAVPSQENVQQNDKHAVDNLATLKAQASPTPSLGGGKTQVVAQYDQAMKFLASTEDGAQEKAIEAFEEIINTYPDDVYANKSYVHAAQACLNIKAYDKALAYFKIALLKNLDVSTAVTVRIGYAKALAASGKAQDACKQLGFLKKQEMDVVQKQDYEDLMGRVCTPAKVPLKTKEQS